jgi:putative endonuclease
MFYLYLIKNKSERWYIGQTADLKRRLTEHISGKNLSTKYDTSWELVYYEAYLSRELVLEREKQLKCFGSAFGHLLKRLRRK